MYAAKYFKIEENEDATMPRPTSPNTTIILIPGVSW